MNNYIKCEGTYNNKVYFFSHVEADSIRLTKILFTRDSDIPEGFEIHTGNYIEQETLCAVLIEEDQIDTEGYEFDLWEENVKVSRKSYFKLSMDFNDNKLIKEARELISQKVFRFKLFYEYKT
jgi:hypothetical protein